MAQKKLSNLEETLALYMRVAGFPAHEREYRFHDTRRWRFDFAWPDIKLAVECEGLTRPGLKSRHTTNKGFSDDLEKYNAAACDGWTVLRYTMPMIKSRVAEKQIQAELDKRL